MDEQKAATKIQSLHRGNSVRKTFKERALERAKDAAAKAKEGAKLGAKVAERAKDATVETAKVCGKKGNSVDGL